MRIILLRHGEVPGNKERRYIGKTDEALSDVGRLQAKTVRLPAVECVYSSPYRRCLQTAELVFPKQKPVVCGELRECDFGIFEGKTADELIDCPQYRDWVAGNCIGQIPGGENVIAFQQRCCNAFETIVRNDAGKKESIAFVAHGGVIMSVLARFDVKKLEFYGYYLRNCAYVCYECKIDSELLLSAVRDEVC